MKGEQQQASTAVDAPAVSEELVVEIATEAHSHTRTVERRLLGLTVRGKVAARVDAAIERRGLRMHCVRAPRTSEPPRAA